MRPLAPVPSMKKFSVRSPGFSFLNSIRLLVVPEPCALSYSISYASVISLGLTYASNVDTGVPE